MSSTQTTDSVAACERSLERRVGRLRELCASGSAYCREMGLERETSLVESSDLLAVCDAAMTSEALRAENKRLRERLRGAFVQGADWFSYESTGRTMWDTERDDARDEACKRLMEERL